MRIAWGTTRTVFLIGKSAIKVPSFVEWRLFLLGLLANMQERKFWTTKDARLCPVRFGVPGGWFIVMSRARPLTRDEWYVFDVERFRDTGEGMVVPSESKMDSYGILDNRIVAVDYGN